MKKRVPLTMEEELIARIDEFAKKNSISRAGAICVLCSQTLMGMKAIETLHEATEEVKKQKEHAEGGTQLELQ